LQVQLLPGARFKEWAMEEKITNNNAAGSPPALLDIPAQVFTSFLQSLSESGAAPELVDRLRTTLLKNKVFSDRALKDAVLGEETIIW